MRPGPGATYKGKTSWTCGLLGYYSFNRNRIITTSGGGMLVSDDERLIATARKLATQAREPVVHYDHTEVGYHYRMSTVLAGIGRARWRYWRGWLRCFGVATRADGCFCLVSVMADFA